MDKSKKLVSLFLSTALAINIAGCGASQPEKEILYDENGNPVEVEERQSGGGFFPFFLPFFGGFGGRGSAITNPNPNAVSPTPGTNSTGTKGTIPSGGISGGAKGGLGSSGGSIGG